MLVNHLYYNNNNIKNASSKWALSGALWELLVAVAWAAGVTSLVQTAGRNREQTRKKYGWMDSDPAHKNTTFYLTMRIIKKKKKVMKFKGAKTPKGKHCKLFFFSVNSLLFYCHNYFRQSGKIFGSLKHHINNRSMTCWSLYYWLESKNAKTKKAHWVVKRLLKSKPDTRVPTIREKWNIFLSEEGTVCNLSAAPPTVPVLNHKQSIHESSSWMYIAWGWSTIKERA